TGPPPRSDDLGASPRATQPRRPARSLRPGGRVTSQRGHIIYSVLGAVRQGRRVGLGPCREAWGLGPGALGLGPWAWGLGPGALGLGPWAWGLGPGALGLGPWAWGLGPCMEAAALGPVGLR